MRAMRASEQVAAERRTGEPCVWVEALGAWVPERWIIAGLGLGEDAAKVAAGWERVEGGWIVARRPVREVAL